MNPLKKTIKTISSVLTIILLIILLVVIYGRLTVLFSKNSYPNYFGYTLFEVSSGSMEPALSINDVILVKLNYKDYEKGDIITYVNEKGEIITHRIVLINADTITVQGDANNTIDNPIKREQIIGKVERVYSQLSVWQKVITEPKILVVLFITLLAFDFALSYDGDNKDVKDKEEKKEKDKKKYKKVKEEKNEKEEQEEKLEKKLENIKIIEDINTKKIDKQEKIKEVKEIKKEEIKELKKEEKDIVPKKEEIKPVPKMRVNDSIDVDALLDFTKKIDLEAINKALEDKTVQLNKKEITGLKKKIDSIDNDNPVLPKLEQKEKDFIEYTIRLDLKAIQKNFKHRGK